MPLNLKQHGPLIAAVAGAVVGAFGLVPIIWGASISLVILVAIAGAMWRRDWLKAHPKDK